MKTTLGTVLGWLLILIFLTSARAEIRAVKSIDRNLEVFIVETSPLVDSAAYGDDCFLNVPHNQLFAFCYQRTSGRWHQIPLQIDDRTLDDGYVFPPGVGGGLLTDYDELAVMIQDLGDQVSENTWIPDGISKNYPRFEIRCIDPKTNKSGWFYLYRSTTYADTLTRDYVNHINNDVYSNVYYVGHNSKGIMNHISFPTIFGQKGPVEIIDRQKVRLKGKANYSGITKEYNETEEELNLIAAHYIDGRVRVIQNLEWKIYLTIGFIEVELPFDLTKVYYAHNVQMKGTTTLSTEHGCQLLRVSIDIHPQNTGAIFYNDRNTNIVLNQYADQVVDRNLDVPGTFWALVTGPRGAFLQMLSMDQKIARFHELYYCERSYGTNDYPEDFNRTKDTGDMHSWGDVGMMLKENVVGRANLATDLFLFREQADSLTAAAMAENHVNPVNWWNGVQPQRFDGMAPAAVALIVTEMETNSLTLAWVAPGDNGTSGGPAAQYEMKYSTYSPMFDEEIWWEMASVVPNLPAPTQPGTVQEVTVSNLTRLKTYYFRLRTKDDAGNWSTISDAVSGKTTPVELASFDFQLQGEDVRLTWKTASETNNYGFNIERRLENTGFEKIGFVEGVGTTSSPQSYAFVDQQVGIGTFYYRLNQLDLDGKSNPGRELKVESLGPQEFDLTQNYPNPFNSQTKIEYSLRGVTAANGTETAFQVQVDIFNLLGQKVQTLVSDQKEVGRHTVQWLGQDNSGQMVGGGVYFYRMSVKSLVDGREVWSKMKKMILMP
jgi:hypothetical protein